MKNSHCMTPNNKDMQSKTAAVENITENKNLIIFNTITHPL